MNRIKSFRVTFANALTLVTECNDGFHDVKVAWIGNLIYYGNVTMLALPRKKFPFMHAPYYCCFHYEHTAQKQMNFIT